MKANSPAQPTHPVSASPEAETSAVSVQAIRYPIYLKQDTLANRFAALLEFAEGLPDDQLPVSIEFIEQPA